MDRGYYTPTFKDFIPGLEYEIEFLPGRWEKFEFLKYQNQVKQTMYAIAREPNTLRIKRLCDADFVETGFKKSTNVNVYIKESDNKIYIIHHEIKSDTVYIRIKRPFSLEIVSLFFGECKNKSELKRILSLLKIQN